MDEPTLLAWVRTGIELIVAGATLTGLETLRYVHTGRAIERGRYRWSSSPARAPALAW